jgi:putative transposase
MTDDRMALIELIEKGADGDLVRELLGFAAERMMELEVGPCHGKVDGVGRCGVGQRHAAHVLRSPSVPG